MGFAEFADTCYKIHVFLQKRAERAGKAAKSDKEDKKKMARYLQTAKELYAFKRLIDMCGQLGQENTTLRNAIEIMAEDEEPVGIPIAFIPFSKDPKDMN